MLLVGDFNSRTGDKLDFIESQGSRFITGNNTFFPSTVDYAITDLHLSSLRAFTVKPLKPFSDHSQISLYIKQSQTLPKPIRTPYHMHKMMSFKWTENSTTNCMNTIESSEIQSLLHSFQIQEYPKNQFGINQAVKDINYIFYKTAQRSDMTILKPKKKKLDTDRWFDLDCKTLRKKLRNLSNQKHRQPENQDLRLHYCEALRQYKATLRRKKSFCRTSLKRSKNL